MTDQKFTAKDARSELVALRQRAAELESQTQKHLAAQLRQLYNLVFDAKESEAVLAEIRDFVSQRD